MTRDAGSYEDVAVVMITRNEEQAIGKVIGDARRALPGTEVVVVDGSDDLTPEIARRAGVTVVREPGGGSGPALLAALMASQRPIIVTVDADDTYPASAFPVLVRLIREGCDVAGADRLGRWPRAMPLSIWLANQAFSALASVRARRRLRDVHSGQRAYRAGVLRAFAWQPGQSALTVDLLFWPALAGLRLIEIPIEYRERIGNSKLSRWAGGRDTLGRLLRSKAAVRKTALREVGPGPWERA